jgi:hypothetical protein
MVVLDHHGMAQVEPMDFAAAGEYRGDVEQTQAGCGLAGMEKSTAGTGERFYETPSEPGDSGSALQQIEKRAFHPEESSPGSVNPPHYLPSDGLALGSIPGHLTAAQSSHGFCVLLPGYYPLTPELNDSRARLVTRSAHLGGQIDWTVFIQNQSSQPRCVSGEIREEF